MAYVPETNSVVAFQNNPSSLQVGASIIGLTPVNVTNNITFNPSSVYVLNPVSTLTINSTTAPSSVQLLEGNAVIGSVAVLQGTNPWVVNVPTPSYISYQAAGSILAVSGNFTSGNTSVTVNNIVTGQSSVQVLNPVSLLAVNPNPSSVYVVNPVSTLSIVVGNMSVLVNNILTGQSSVYLIPGVGVLGSVAVLQGTNPWQINVPSPSTIAYQLAGSVLAVSGSFSSGNTSVTVNNIVTGQSSVYLIPGVGVLGSVATLQGTNPWKVELTSGSIITTTANTSVTAYMGGAWATSMVGGPINVNSILGTYLEKNAITPSVFGFPMLFKNGADNSVLSTISTTTPLPIRGSVATLQGTNPWITLNTGSILTIQTTSTNASVITVIRQGNSSVTGTMSVLGTVPVTFAGGYSIVGTYNEDSAHTSAQPGVFMLHVRNDTYSSVTTADGDYSTNAVGPAGETVVANAPITKWVVGRTSVMNGVSVQVLAAPGTSILTYITGIHVINESPNTARVTLTQGLGAVVASVLTYAIAPAGGGSNSTYINPIRVLDNNGISASINSAAASVYVTITGFTAKT